MFVGAYVYVCVCMCVRERDRERIVGEGRMCVFGDYTAGCYGLTFLTMTFCRERGEEETLLPMCLFFLITKIPASRTNTSC